MSFPFASEAFDYEIVKKILNTIYCVLGIDKTRYIWYNESARKKEKEMIICIML